MTATTMRKADKAITRRPRKRRKADKPTGARALLLALALGGTLGGWGMLASSAMKNNVAATPAPEQTVGTTSPIAEADVAAIALAPVPTVQPPPSHLNVVSATQSLPVSQLAPLPAVPQRVVIRPITRTRSSR